MSNAKVFVDWYSFTIPSASDGKTELANLENARRLAWWIENEGGEDVAFLHMLKQEGWFYTRGRRPYSGGYSHERWGIKVWFGGQKTILVEISGRGCQQLRDVKPDGAQTNGLEHIIQLTHFNCTRIDFAVDMETKTRPHEFVDAGYNKRIKSTGDLRSGSGETYYVGSRKSKSRYARVYRWESAKYAHRAHLLRCEMVAMKKYAKEHARISTYAGVAYAAQCLSNYFQWGHEDMPKLENHNETVSAPTRKTDDASRLAWLKHQVAPAVRDLIRRQVITMQDIIEIFGVEELQMTLFDDDFE